MELEALQRIHSEVRDLGAQIVVLTPELERYTRALHKKLNLTFDILTDLHLKTAEQFRLVYALPDSSFRQTSVAHSFLYRSFCHCLAKAQTSFSFPRLLHAPCLGVRANRVRHSYPLMHPQRAPSRPSPNISLRFWGLVASA